MNKVLIFTICSNNYLPQALVLAKSVEKYVPESSFVIGLVDSISSEIDYSKIPGKILPIAEVGIDKKFDNIDQYNIVELNTAVKGFLFQHFLHTFPDVEYVYYFDPDMCLFHSIKCLEDALCERQIVLTPHILTPLPDDGKHPLPMAFLSFGLYNFGFVGIRRGPVANAFVDWFASMLGKYCFDNRERGLFVDQLWGNYVPVFWDEQTLLIRHPGCNMAYWNFHERRLSVEPNGSARYVVNDKYPLVFFHFSNYRPFDEAPFTRYQTRFDYKSRPIECKLYEEYKKELLIPEYKKWKAVPCVYKQKQKTFRQKLLQKCITFLKRYE